MRRTGKVHGDRGRVLGSRRDESHSAIVQEALIKPSLTGIREPAVGDERACVVDSGVDLGAVDETP